MKKIIIFVFVILLLTGGLHAQVKGEVPLKLTTMKKYLSLGEQTIRQDNFFNDLSSYLCTSINFNEGAEKYQKNNAIKEYLELANQFLAEFRPAIKNDTLLLDIKDQEHKTIASRFFTYFGASLDPSLIIKELDVNMLYVRRRLLLTAMGYNIYEINASLNSKSISIDMKPDIFVLPDRIKNITTSVFWGVLLNNKKFLLYQCALANMDQETIAFVEQDKNIFQYLNETEAINLYLVSDALWIEEAKLHYPGGSEFMNLWLKGVGAADDKHFLLNIIEDKNKRWRYLFKVLSRFDDNTVSKILDNSPKLIDRISQWSISQTYERKIDAGQIVKDDIFDMLWVLFVMDEGSHLDVAEKIIRQGYQESSTNKLDLATLLALSSHKKETEFKDAPISQILHIYAFFKTHNFPVNQQMIESLKELILDYHNAMHYLQDINFTDPELLPAFHHLVVSLQKMSSADQTTVMRIFQSDLEFLSILSRNELATPDMLNQLMKKLISTTSKEYQIHFLEWFYNELFPYLTSEAFKDSSYPIDDPLMFLMKSNKGREDIELDAIMYNYQPAMQSVQDVSKIQTLQSLLFMSSVTELWNDVQSFQHFLNDKKIEPAKESLLKIIQILNAYKPLEFPVAISPDFQKSFLGKKELEAVKRKCEEFQKINDNEFYKKTQKLLPDLKNMLAKIAGETMIGYVYCGAVMNTDSLFYYEKNMMREHQFVYDSTLATLSILSSGTWMNTYFSSSSAIGQHFVNSAYGIKFLLPGREAQALVFAEGSHILNDNIFTFSFASLVISDWRNYSEQQLITNAFSLFDSILSRAHNDAHLKSILLHESRYVIGSQRTALFMKAIASNEDIDSIVTPSDKLFILKRMSVLESEQKEFLTNEFKQLFTERALHFTSFYLSHSLQDSFFLCPSYETMAEIDPVYLSERLIDTKIALMYQLEKISLPHVLLNALLAKAERMIYTHLYQDDYYDWKGYLLLVNSINENSVTEWIEELKTDGVIILK